MPQLHLMLTRLTLRDFRCFGRLECELGGGSTVFVGDNAQGKTTILEAACVLMRLQSPRTSALSEVIRFGEKAFAVEGMLGDTRLQLGYSSSRRKLAVDGETQTRGADYLRYSGLVVWMANDDLDLVRGGGDKRRRFLDFVGAQVDPGYRPALRSYEKALRSRNFLLKKDATGNRAQIDAYGKLLIEHGDVLQQARAKLIEALGPLAREADQQVSETDDVLLELVYQPSGGGCDEGGLALALQDSREEEWRRRLTVVGPHRDDFALMLNGMPAASFASEGQQRTIALALKLGQAAYLEDQRGSKPLLLLDDIFGELDKARRNALITALPAEAQKLITTTHLDWLEAANQPARLYRVEAGSIV